MEIKLKQLFGARDVFKKIFDEPLETKLSYRISKISKKVNSALEDIEEHRISLIHKYADEQTVEDIQKATPKKVTKRLNELVKEFGAYLETKSNLDIQPIPFELLQDVKLSANDLNIIEPFIEEGDTNAKD